MCGKGRGKEDEEAPSGSTASYLDFYCSDKLHDYMQLREEKGSFSLSFQITAILEEVRAGTQAGT